MSYASLGQVDWGQAACETTLQGVYNAETQECDLSESQVWPAGLAVPAVCQSIGGVWSDERKSCKLPQHAPVPPETPPPPPAKAPGITTTQVVVLGAAALGAWMLLGKKKR